MPKIYAYHGNMMTKNTLILLFITMFIAPPKLTPGAVAMEIDVLPALHAAAGVDDFIAVVDFLRQGMPVNELDYADRTALHVAAMNNAPAAASMLLFHGADVNRTDYNGVTAAHLAAEYNAPIVLISLNQHHANFEILHNGKSPFAYALQNNNTEAILAFMQIRNAAFFPPNFFEHIDFNLDNLTPASRQAVLLILEGRNEVDALEKLQ